MSFYPSVYSTASLYRTQTSEIYDIFRSHMRLLSDQEIKANQIIEEWSTGLIAQIRDYAFEQKKIVRQASDSLQNFLDDMRNQFVEISIIYEKKQDTEEMKQLLERCKTLKVELVKLEFYSMGKDFIKVTPVEPPERLDQEKSDESRTTDKSSVRSSIKKDATDISLDRNNSNLNGSSTSTFLNSDRIK